MLIDMGALAREDVTMASIRDWLRANPDRARDVMAKNRSFIFFAASGETGPSSGAATGPAMGPAMGPVGAASVPLTAGRSLALDHGLHTFGSPVWIATHMPLPGESKPFRRLMIHQDTGSAITGPARGDLFVGSGDEAGAVAGAIRHDADFVVLVPKDAG